MGQQAQSKMAQARRNMVTQQVLTNGVRNHQAVEALCSVPREQFVPAAYQRVAYFDDRMPLGVDASGMMRYLMEPKTFAQMLDLVALTPQDKVLEVGCASGYTTAVLARLAHHVYAVESDEVLAGHAGNNLRAVGASNVSLSIGSLAEGYAAQAPYEAIFVSGATACLPPAWCDQLKEGGRIVFIRKESGGHLGSVCMGRKVQGVVSARAFYDVAADYLPGLEKRGMFAL